MPQNVAKVESDRYFIALSNERVDSVGKLICHLWFSCLLLQRKKRSDCSDS